MTSSSHDLTQRPPALHLADAHDETGAQNTWDAEETVPSPRVSPRSRRQWPRVHDSHHAHDGADHASSVEDRDHEDAAGVEQLLARAAEARGAERDRLLERATVSQLGLARSMAMRYRDRGEPLEDLIQVANLALVMAVQRYRPDQGVPFAAFAVPTITGELRRHFRDRGWNVRPPRRLQELRARMQNTALDLAQELGRAPSSEQLAERLDVDVEEVREAAKAAEGYHSLSLDAPAATADGQQLVDWLGEEDGQYEHTIEALAVRPLLAGLDERTRHILCLRYYRGCTQQQIADEIGVTQMQVSRLISQALTRLRQDVAMNGHVPVPHARTA